MKKVFGLTILVIVLTMFVGGCSNDGDDNAHTECVWDNWVVTRAATCLVGGEETSACNVCSKTRTRPTEILGHNLSDWAITTPVTCMTAGEESRTCTRDGCNHNENRPIAATGHTFGELTQTLAATCIAVGEMARVCSTCGEKTGVQEIPMLSHDLGTWDTTKVAVCGGEVGSRTRICQRPNCPHSVTEEIPIPNHNWGASGVITPATCTEAGERGQVCSLCGDTRNVTAIPILNHTWSTWEITTPSECDKDGEETKVCTRENCEHSEKRVLSTDCITISTATELAAFRDAVNAGDTFLGKTVSLTTDIQLTGAWVPIGRGGSVLASRQFRGNFDGNGRTISGVDIQGSISEQGFFYEIHGTVKNLNLHVTVSGGSNLGGIAAYNSGTIINSGVSGTITGAGHTIGGLVGNNRGRIENSHSNVRVSGGGSGTLGSGGGQGGLVGTNSSDGEIFSSYATGDVSATDEGTIYIGGLAGTNSGRIQNSYATGNLVANSQSWNDIFAGGLVGNNRFGARVVDSYATGNVNATSPGPLQLGGLIGINNADIVGVSNSFYNSETSEQSDTGKGDPKTTAEMREQTTFTNWNFDTIWGISPTINDGYPHLRVFQ
jgi:hypothetical protein